MKKFMILFSVLVLLFICQNVQADDNDFSQYDYQRVLKGEKNLSEARLSGANLKGMDLSCRNFTNADLEGANLEGANLSNANFSHADLDNANLQKANLSSANFYHADLEEANLKGASIKNAIFKETELEYTTWVNGRICAEGSIGGCW